jgi:hypothetical protein
MSDDNTSFWEKLLAALVTIVIVFFTVVVTKLAEMFFAGKKLTPEDKLSRLDEALRNGKMSKEEWQKARDSVISNYSAHA